MQRFIPTAVLLAIALANPAMAEEMQATALQSTQVATLLPPPVEALAATSAAKSSPDQVAVPVLKQPVQKGETITADNVTLQTIPASQAFASTIKSADQLIGQQAVRPLTAGQPVNTLHVRIAPLVSRNQAVTIMYRKGGIELTGRAQALEDGQVGQSIRVINPTTRSTIVGTVAQDGTVAVN